MKFSAFLAMCCMVGATASTATAQDIEFTEYLGSIPTQNFPLAIEGDAEGNLYYGTFEAANSKLVVVEDPFTQIDAATIPGDIVYTFTEMESGRGVQGLQIAPDGTVFVGGDTNKTTIANMWKFERASLDPLTFSESFSFKNQAQADSPKRRHGLAIVSTAGDGLLAATYFSGIDFFDFDGNRLSGVTDGTNYMREPVYNAQDNIIYPLRNGVSSNNMIDYYYTNINTTDGTGATRVNAVSFIDDGASNGGTGNAAQNGYYYADQHQLITVDGPVTIGGNAIPPKVRIWDIIENGTSITLAYSIDEDSEGAPFSGISDAAVIGNRLYVTGRNTNEIYVYGPVNASVGRWEDYELY